MNLVIDIGNSRVKAAVFSGEEIIERWCSEDFGPAELENILAKYPGIQRSILSSTRDEIPETERSLAGRMRTFIRFAPIVKTPLKNRYGTPHTLGPDRLAAAVGASRLYPGRNIMVVDFGTAMTIDLVTAGGEYMGGVISPGARMRFRALSDYTARLPLGSLPAGGESPRVITGQSTAEAIEAGVINGVVFELEGYIKNYADEFDDPAIVFTGGDADFFAERLKNTIFADYDLVLVGLNTILEYNANN